MINYIRNYCTDKKCDMCLYSISIYYHRNVIISTIAGTKEVYIADVTRSRVVAWLRQRGRVAVRCDVATSV